MITKFHIDNFKSLVNFSMPCHALTCLIGMNNTGKSTILQAIDFVGCIASGNVSQWLKDRAWKIKEIKSQFKRQYKITFKLHFILQDNNYVWEGTLKLHSLNCDTERIVQIGSEEDILLEVAKGSYTFSSGLKKSIDFNYEGSILASLKEQVLNDELRDIKKFLQSVKTLELLDPLLLRKRARTTEEDIGIEGEKLSAFLYNLPQKKQKAIYQHIHHLFEHFENYHIKAKRSGWKELWIIEKVSGVPGTFFPFLNTEAKHISDGFLRMLAIFSQLQTNYAVLLFDEIEDGLNHEVMEYLLDVMLKSPQQIYFTTHSPMILNFLEDEVAQNSVILVYKDYKAGGQTKTVRFFDIPQIKDKLEYMGPGEIFANVNLKQLP